MTWPCCWLRGTGAARGNRCGNERSRSAVSRYPPATRGAWSARELNRQSSTLRLTQPYRQGTALQFHECVPWHWCQGNSLAISALAVEQLRRRKETRRFYRELVGRHPT